jgi:hypothetical protein
MATSGEARFLAPIQIRYDGLDAQTHQIDMAMLGESLQGAARLIGVAAHIAATAEYTNRTPSMQFRVLTTAPESHCVTVAAILHFAAAASPMLFDMPSPDLVEKIVNYILSSLGGQRQNDQALEVIGDSIQALKEANANTAQLALEGIGAMREVALAAIQAVKEAAADQRPAARHFAVPIGESAAQAIIGNPETAFVVDRAAREAIDFEPVEEIRDTLRYTVKLTELDIKTGTGKAELEGLDPAIRYSCAIVDPVVHNAQSAYSSALNEQRWIQVLAKPHFQNGELHKLTILDTIKS